MAIATLDGQALMRLDLIIPRWGLWTCDAQLEGQTAPAVGTAITLDIGGVQRSGTVTRAGAPYGQARCRIVGGAGKLDEPCSPSDYGQVTAAQVAGDVIGQAGEAIGDLSALSGVVLTQWQLVEERAWQALQRVFRMAPGADLWCERGGALSARQTVWARTVAGLWRGVVPQERGVVLFADSADVEPGVRVTTMQGDFDVERVQYVLDPDDARSGLRANCWYV